MSTNEQSRLARSAKLPKEAGRLKALADWFNGALLPVIPSKAIHGATPVTTDELLEDMQREKEATEEDVVPLLLYPQAWAQPAYRDKPLLTTTQAIDSQMVCRENQPASLTAREIETGGNIAAVEPTLVRFPAICFGLPPVEPGRKELEKELWSTKKEYPDPEGYELSKLVCKAQC
ncbi:hypothetical protein PG988_012762 [Apiospora saccharicola]